MCECKRRGKLTVACVFACGGMVGGRVSLLVEWRFDSTNR